MFNANSCPKKNISLQSDIQTAYLFYLILEKKSENLQVQVINCFARIKLQHSLLDRFFLLDRWLLIFTHIVSHKSRNMNNNFRLLSSSLYVGVPAALHGTTFQPRGFALSSDRCWTGCRIQDVCVQLFTGCETMYVKATVRHLFQ